MYTVFTIIRGSFNHVLWWWCLPLDHITNRYYSSCTSHKHKQSKMHTLEECTYHNTATLQGGGNYIHNNSKQNNYKSPDAPVPSHRYNIQVYRAHK